QCTLLRGRCAVGVLRAGRLRCEGSVTGAKAGIEITALTEGRLREIVIVDSFAIGYDRRVEEREVLIAADDYRQLAGQAALLDRMLRREMKQDRGDRGCQRIGIALCVILARIATGKLDRAVKFVEPINRD